MIICMSDIICVTNRVLCSEDFLTHIKKIAAGRPAGIILREKDLTETEYKQLAKQVLQLCRAENTMCILHNFVTAALELKAEAIHLPMSVLRQTSDTLKQRFKILGASCHSAKEALEAQSYGCTYITAGHIFATACKDGVPARGLGFLKEVCEAVSIPVYAVGGINSENIFAVRKAGAAGACVMSGLMQCEEVEFYIKTLESQPQGVPKNS